MDNSHRGKQYEVSFLLVNSQFSLVLLSVALVILILLSAFFSSSETGMMALNRYRLRHQAKTGHKGAKRTIELLRRTDRLLSAILIGNNFINILASSLATVIALQLFGDAGVLVATIVLTFSLLIFGEVTPKMLAAMYPERVALLVSPVLGVLMKVLYPFTLMINVLSTSLIRIFGIKVADTAQDHLNQEELRTLVHESGGQLPRKHQGMLLGILDLDTVDIDDIMIPRNEIVGIDLEDDIKTILSQLKTVQYTRLPVYRGDINNVVGLLHMRSIARIISQDKVFTKQCLENEILSPYFVPEGTPLHTQLYNFQNEKRRLAMVVDEYGDIQGLVTLEDILEEIVGKFTTDEESTDEIMPGPDGSFIIQGTASIREVNKSLGWELPIDGPKTVNGLIVETLEEIPAGNACIMIDNYCIEILTLSENKVESVRVTVKKNE